MVNSRLRDGETSAVFRKPWTCWLSKNASPRLSGLLAFFFFTLSTEQTNSFERLLVTPAGSLFYLESNWQTLKILEMALQEMPALQAEVLNEINTPVFTGGDYRKRFITEKAWGELDV